MIKVAQLLVVQHSLQMVEDGTVDYPVIPLEEMHTQFILCDGQTPMSWILGLCQYGKKLSDTMTMEGHIAWSDDNQTITFKKFHCSLTNFRSFIRIQVTKAQEELAQLFLIDNMDKLERVISPLRLAEIKDNPGESQVGWNFLKDNRNSYLFNGSN